MKLGGGKSLVYLDYEKLEHECETYESDVVLKWYIDDYEKLKMNKPSRIGQRDRVLLSSLSIVLSNCLKPNILDFGGGIGSDFFFCKEILNTDRLGKWVVCENEKIASAFKQIIKGESSLIHISHLRELSQLNIKIDFVYMSGTLQYLGKDPMMLLDELIKLNPRFIFINRTPMWDKPARLTKQLRPKLNPDENKRITYPCWIFNETGIITFMEQKGYEKYEFVVSYDRPYIQGFGFLEYKSYFFKRLN